jgi:hypothetical protein
VTHFVLVHGGWHGAWCWTPLVDALRVDGHTATAVHLPSDVVGAGAEAYADTVAASVAPGGSVVVGHSLAGLTLPLVPDRTTVTALVYLASLLPEPGSSWREQLARSRPMNDWFYEHALPRQGRDEQGRTYWEPETAQELFFHDCTDDVARSAAGRLRPQASTPVAETTPVRAFPDVPTRYVICEQDRAVSPEWAARAARERLGVEPLRISGSHSPFLARPAELARLLVSVTAGSTVRGGR